MAMGCASPSDQRGDTASSAPSDAGADDSGAGSSVDASGDAGLLEPDSGAADIPAAPECNGHASLCARRYDEVAFVATHNAMSNAEDGWILPNQQFGIAQQLDDGVRAFLIDTYLFDGQPALCHAICEAGTKPLADALGELREFLNQHPREVVSLLVEDHLSATDFEAVVVASELLPLVYTHRDGAWPTLGEMIETNRRLVVMAEFSGPPPDWYHPMWELAFDTPYTFASVEDFTCELNRGSAGNSLFLLNHWLSDPVSLPEFGPVANAYPVLSARARACTAAHGRIPNFVAVDFYADGDVFRVVDELNQVAPGGK
jgi:hypothetical protein